MSDIRRYAPPEGAFIVPDLVAEAAMRGNLYFPQTTTALSIFAGHAAMELVLQEDMSLSNIVTAAPSMEQLEGAAESVERAHRAFRVGYILDDSRISTRQAFAKYEHEPFELLRRLRPDGLSTFTSRRLAQIVTGYSHRVNRAAADFAASTMLFTKTVPKKTPIHLFTLVDEKVEYELQQRQLKAIDALTSRPERLGGAPRPQAVALGELFRVAAEAIDPVRSETGKRISRTILRSIRTMYDPESTPGAIETANVDYMGTIIDMYDVVEAAIVREVPAIRQRTGVRLRKATVNRFLETMVAGYKD